MERFLAILGRIYFVLLLPYLAAAVGPWLFGPGNAADYQFVLLWSFTLLVFINALMTGLGVRFNPRLVFAFTMLAVGHVALALFAVLWGLKASTPFAGFALLTVLHWSTWLWNQRFLSIRQDVYRLHNRFVWGGLACHMFILLNLAWVLRQLPV